MRHGPCQRAARTARCGQLERDGPNYDPLDRPPPPRTRATLTKTCLLRVHSQISTLQADEHEQAAEALSSVAPDEAVEAVLEAQQEAVEAAGQSEMEVDEARAKSNVAAADPKEASEAQASVQLELDAGAAADDSTEKVSYVV